MLLWQMFPVFLLWIHIQGTPLQKPDFVSSWYELSVEKDDLNSVNITHGLGELPVYVQVQVKSTSEPNKDFIFPGVGTCLRDDDERQPRSGMIYLYNEENIIVSAPTANNNIPGSAIYTENSQNWEGPNSQDSTSAIVRVRLWKGSSFPKPDFHSSGDSIGTQCDTNDNVCFYEKLHNFDEYPSFVIVRTKLLNEDSQLGGYMSDGVGASHAVHHRPTPTANGYVIYGFNTSAIRVWTDSSKLGAIFDCFDGSEFEHVKYDFLTGELEIMAWRSTTLQQDFENFIEMGAIPETNFEMETAYSLGTHPETDSIVGVVWVEAQDGENNGFRFPGTGAMAFTLFNDVDPCSYGGLTYAYTNTTLRLWKPKSSGAGKLICIANIFAAGKYSQASNNGKAVMKIWTVSSLDTSCSTDSDCKDQFTECCDSICRCQSGYFQSLSQCWKGGHGEQDEESRFNVVVIVIVIVAGFCVALAITLLTIGILRRRRRSKKQQTETRTNTNSNTRGEETMQPNQFNQFTNQMTSDEVMTWLQNNSFSNCRQYFNQYTGEDLLKLLKEDFQSICGPADGIRLYNRLEARQTGTRTNTNSNTRGEETMQPNQFNQFTNQMTSDEVMTWLQNNSFSNCRQYFNQYTGEDLLKLLKEDFQSICGPADGIRLYNRLEIIHFNVKCQHVLLSRRLWLNMIAYVSMLSQTGTRTNTNSNTRGEETMQPNQFNQFTNQMTSDEVMTWLQNNSFSNCRQYFNQYTGEDLLKLLKEDFQSICGPADGIRLYNRLEASNTAGLVAEQQIHAAEWDDHYMDLDDNRRDRVPYENEAII